MNPNIKIENGAKSHLTFTRVKKVADEFSNVLFTNTRIYPAHAGPDSVHTINDALGDVC